MRFPIMLTTCLAGLVCLTAAAQPAKTLRPPAYPLITHDPYFSVWSMTDTLTDSWPRHWTGATMGMCGLVRVDGKTYRWCGNGPTDIPVAEQKQVMLSGPTQTQYHFVAGAVDVWITFTSPLGAGTDLVQASQAASTIHGEARSRDNAAHDVQFYIDVSGEWVVNEPGQRVNWSRHRIAGREAVSIGSVDLPVLAAAGDNRRIDWGRLYLVGTGDEQLAASSHGASRGAFVRTGKASQTDDMRMPRAAQDDYPVLAAVSGKNGFNVILAYDDQFSIELFDRKLRPLWNQDGNGLERAVAGLVTAASTARGADDSQAEDPFSGNVNSLGEEFGQLLTIAYRQVLAGHKLVADWDGTPLMFSKENTSNGCIATIDVIYPACPFFLYHSPEMLKAQLRPLMMYSASNRWKFPFAPHDLGTYPKANGQVYGGGERDERDQMPVEESGNMLIMLAALARAEGNAEFSKPYEAIIERWAMYLKDNGLDPANQLCTDDFAGHLARNSNLSAKTVVALGAYAQLLKALGHPDKSAAWNATAREYASKWIELSKDGPTTVLAFGNPGTWSQKYNLIWDRVLGLNLFPQEVFDRELKTYSQHMQKYGLPLDSRQTYTKLDWTVWSACLTGRRADFDSVMSRVYAYVNETPSRVPLSDWYETTDGKTKGMHTRTVVGGIWMPLLMEKMGVGLK